MPSLDSREACRTGLVVAAIAMGWPGAWAQEMPGAAAAAAPSSGLVVQPSVSARVTATTNGNFNTTGPAQHDVILDSTASVAVRGRGPRYELNGNMSVQGVGYVDHSQQKRVLPSGRVDGKLVVVEHLVSVDGSVSAEQTMNSPFAAAPEGGSTSNRVSTQRYTVSPTLKQALSAETDLLVRSEQSLTRSNGASLTPGTTGDAHVQHNIARIERRPTPFGLEGEVVRDDTRYRGQTQSALTINTARVTASYLWDQQLRVGLIGGHDKTVTSLGRESGPLWGGRINWRPDERTNFDVRGEHRSFGTGWDVALRHRSPGTAWEVALLREPNTAAQTIGTLPAGGNIGTLLDAMLTTRVPDPLERAGVVNKLIAANGLATSLATPLTLFDSNPQLHQSARASFALIGNRSTVTWSAYVDRTSPLAVGTGGLPPLASRTTQTGAQVELTHRLTQLITLDGALRWARAKGLDANGIESSSLDRLARAGLRFTLSPKTVAVLGLRRELLRSTVASDSSETAVYVGIDHRF